MQVIGVIGGVASGKSLVTELLVAWGAERFDADRAGHRALEDPQVVAAAVSRWGREVLDEHGAIRRPAVAQRVFRPDPAGRADLEFLESQTHPLIRRAFQQQIAAARQAGAKALVVDAALLVEARWDELCDDRPVTK